MNGVGIRRVARAVVLLSVLSAPLGAAATRAAADGAAPRHEDSLVGRVLRRAHEAKLGAARLNWAVIDVATGELLSGRDVNRGVPIASLTKLVTAAALLAELGPGYRIQTLLYADAWAADDGKETGAVENLYLQGRGDPALSLADLDTLADALARRGVQEVRGKVVIDETYFDDRRDPPLFDTRQTDAAYRAPVGALSLADNAIGIVVYPARRVGRPARVAIWPNTGYAVVLSDVATVAATKKQPTLVLETAATETGLTVRLRGEIAQASSEQILRRRVPDPGRFAGLAFVRALQRAGIVVAQPEIVRGPVSARARQIAVHRSPPLSALVTTMNKRSNNFVAEQLLKVLGAEAVAPPGTSEKGLLIVARFLSGLGFVADDYLIKNASGLYQASRFSARQIVQVLSAGAADFRYGPEFVASLPIAGVDGTLAGRFSDSGVQSWVRAKTGTLASVITLAGYASGPRGRLLAFSFLLTELPAKRQAAARRAIDAMVVDMVETLLPQATTATLQQQTLQQQTVPPQEATSP